MDIRDLAADFAPPLPIKEWPELGPFLVYCLENGIQLLNTSSDDTATAEMVDVQRSIQCALLGTLQTLNKLLEDAPVKFEHDVGSSSFLRIVPAIIKLLQSQRVLQRQPEPTQWKEYEREVNRIKTDALSCCISLVETMPSTLVVAMNDFLGVLSSLGSDTGSDVRKLVCRALVAL